MSTSTKSPPCLVLGGVSSGVGKTTISCGIIRAFRRRGLEVAPFKCGPDYLDPSYLSRAARRRAHNLDSWMMGQQALRSTFLRTSAGADLAVVEGVMGIFDGAVPTDEAGSTAQIAKWLGAPAVLVVDAGGMARSVAALVKGFQDYDPQLALQGVICNRVGSQRHLDLLRQALGEKGSAIVGGLPKKLDCTFSGRHLGLLEARTQVVQEEIFDQLAELVEQWIDLDALLEMAKQAQPLQAADVQERNSSAVRCRIGIAQDEAFSFYYDENLDLLRAQGAELVEFSPLRDPQLPAVDGLYIGGGYPELHAQALQENHSMRSEIAAFIARGRPVYAECGGLMYLCQGIEGLDGQKAQMVGALAGWAKLCDRIQALGYTEVCTTRDSPLGPAGTRYRGHQFRYSKLQELGEEPHCAFELRRRRDGATQAEGYLKRRALGSYVHGHWASNPQIALNFVRACSQFPS